MDDATSRVEDLNRRLELLERRTAVETAAIRAELDELRGRRPAAPASGPPPQHADLSWLTGPRGLALAGGAVTLLGIVFVFVLAAGRGWIGPGVRCSIGGGVSLLLVGSALLVRRRFGGAASSLAAAGTGIGGCYVTLYAASRGYHLLDAGVVWAAVVLVAVAAVTLALAWSSEALAALALVASVLAPPAVEGRLTGLGLGASAIAAAAALGIGQQRRWRLLGGLAYGPVLAQSAVFVGSSRPHAGLLACVIFALALAGATAYQRRGAGLDWLAAALAAVSLPFALLSIWRLVDGTHAHGAALLGLAAAYGGPAVALRLDGRLRELADLLAAFALFAVALATATYLSNGGLLSAWTLEGVALIALAARLGLRRYQAAGLAYLGAAVMHLLVFEAPLDHLFTERSHPAEHMAELLLLVAVLAASALLLRGRELLLPRLDLSLAATATLLALYAASLGLLEATQRLGGADLHAKFQRGETSVSALWALAALALLAAGLMRSSRELRYGGLALLGLALVKLFGFDLARLSSLTRAGSFLAVGLALLAGGFLVQRLGELKSAGSRRSGARGGRATS